MSGKSDNAEEFGATWSFLVILLATKVGKSDSGNQSPGNLWKSDHAEEFGATWFYSWQPKSGKSHRADAFEATWGYLVLPCATSGIQSTENLIMHKSSGLPGATRCYGWQAKSRQSD